jgi:hypothetical protein
MSEKRRSITLYLKGLHVRVDATDEALTPGVLAALGELVRAAGGDAPLAPEKRTWLLPQIGTGVGTPATGQWLSGCACGRPMPNDHTED